MIWVLIHATKHQQEFVRTEILFCVFLFLHVFVILSPAENADLKQDCGVGGAKNPSSPSTKGTVNKDSSCNNEEEACWDSHDSDDADDCKDFKNSNVKHKNSTNTPDIPYPEPRVPFPCTSSLSIKDQKTYLGILMSKKSIIPPQVQASLSECVYHIAHPCCIALLKLSAPTFQNLMARVNSEVMQFIKYLEAVSKMCADDYQFIPQAAIQYSEVLVLRPLILSPARMCVWNYWNILNIHMDIWIYT